MKPQQWILAGLFVIVVSVGLYLWLFPPPSPPCTASGWDRQLGFDVFAKVKDAEGVRAKIGISDAQVRQFDNALKDYALKYDAACQDVTAHRMTAAEYACRRQNMDRALDAVRIFAAAIDAAKATTADPVAQKEVMLKAMSDVKAATDSNFGGGCTSALSVDPKTITFGRTAERSIQVSNGGNNALTFSVDNLPEAFLPQPKSGTVPPGETRPISIYRLNLPIDRSRPVRFHIRSNFLEVKEIEILVTEEGAALYAEWRAEVRSQGPTVASAVLVVDRSLPADAVNREAAKFVLAGDILFQLGSPAEATIAINRAVETNRRAFSPVQAQEIITSIQARQLVPFR